MDKNSKILFDEFYKELYEATPLATQSLDEKGNLIMVNDAWCKELGYTRDEVIGTNFEEYLKPTVVQTFRKSFPDFRKRGSVENIEFDMIRKDGTISYVNFIGRVSYDKDANFIRTNCIFKEISKEKALQKKLESNKHYLEAIFDANPNIMIVTDGNEIDRVNQQMLEFTGYVDLDAFKQEHSCICDLFLKGGKDCITSTIDGEKWIDYIYARPTKTHMVCMLKKEVQFYFNVIVKRLDIDEKERYIVVFNEITQQYQLEKELRESKKLFDYFMNNIPFSIVIKDENLRIKYANKHASDMAEAFSFHLSQGSTTAQNLGKELAQKVDDLARKTQKEGVAEGIFEYKTAKGDFIFRVFSFAIPLEGGEINVGTLYIDITKEKHLANDVREKEELMIAQSRHAAMGEMISMIAHQWRQPISVISMDANNILIDIELDAIEVESLKEDATDIVAQTQHLSKTIDDFRDFFKPNKLKDEVLVSDVFTDTISVIGTSFENNNVEIETVFEDTTKIEIYSRELLQVLLNILKNAKEALVETREENRKIKTKVYEDEENIIIEISDNAGGIKEEILEKIFNPYFSTKDEKNGTGLGLYMSKTIIEKHLHGKLEVKNIQDGVMFTITLPKIGELA